MNCDFATVREERELWNGPRYIKWSARILSASIIQFATIIMRLISVTTVSTGLKMNEGSQKQNKYTILLTAGAASPNWLKNHLLPLADSDRCREIRMVADSKLFEHPKISWIVPKWWLRCIIGRTPARLLTYYHSAAKRRPDICGGFHLLPNGITALMTAKWLKTKSLYFCVGGMTEIIGGAAYNEHYPFGRTGNLNGILEKRLIEFVCDFDLVITMGNGAKHFLENRGIQRPIEVIPGGIDPREFIPAGGEKCYDLIVTCRLVPVKRLDIFLRVVQNLAKIWPTVQAVIVGDGEQKKELISMAWSLGIADRIVFAGQQTDVSAYLQKSRIFLLTSDSEGLALSLMEAMMCGLPAVTSDVGDLKDLVKNGVNGWLVPRRNVQAFSEKVISILQDTTLYRQFSFHARTDAMRVSLPETTQRWNRILQTKKDAS